MLDHDRGIRNEGFTDRIRYLEDLGSLRQSFSRVTLGAFEVLDVPDSSTEAGTITGSINYSSMP